MPEGGSCISPPWHHLPLLRLLLPERMDLLHAFFDGGMAHDGATMVYPFGLMDSDRHCHAAGYSGQTQAVENLQGKQEFACV